MVISLKVPGIYFVWDRRGGIGGRKGAWGKLNSVKEQRELKEEE